VIFTGFIIFVQYLDNYVLQEKDSTDQTQCFFSYFKSSITIKLLQSINISKR